MQIKPITHNDFVKYGHIIEDYNFGKIINTLNNISEKPDDKVIYIPSEKELENHKIHTKLQDNFYGGMPIQIGYCNGYNRALNCLEYHRGSEINIAADDVILLLAPKQKIIDNKLNTSQVEAFLLPMGKAVVLYETTLHYAPCSAADNTSFRVVIVLPKDTNTQKPNITPTNNEDKMLFARNKWLLAHKDAPEAKNGAYIGLAGENIIL